MVARAPRGLLAKGRQRAQQTHVQACLRAAAAPGAVLPDKCRVGPAAAAAAIVGSILERGHVPEGAFGGLVGWSEVRIVLGIVRSKTITAGVLILIAALETCRQHPTGQMILIRVLFVSILPHLGSVVLYVVIAVAVVVVVVVVCSLVSKQFGNRKIIFSNARDATQSLDAPLRRRRD